MLNSQAVGSKTRVAPHRFVEAEQGAESIPEPFRAHPNHKIATVAAAEKLIGHNTGMGIAQAARNVARVQIATAHVREPSQLRIKQGHVEELTPS